VSVVVPLYNYGRYLPEAVDSALQQPGVDVEVIIVDDASTDGSQAVARRLQRRDPRVTLIEHERNLRHIRTYNDGLARASGEYLVLLSADDALTPGSLARSVALFEAHPRVGLVYGRIAAYGAPIPRPVANWWQVWAGGEWVRHVCRRGRNMIANPEVVVRADVYRDIGGYDLDLPHAADMLMWLQTAARSDIGFVGGPRQAVYRTHDTNMHVTAYIGATDDMTQVRDVYARFFADAGATLPGAGRMRELAMASVAREALLRAALLGADGAPPATVVALRDFARRTSQRAPATAAWAWSAPGGRVPPGAIRAAERARWKIRSRRTDLVGL